MIIIDVRHFLALYINYYLSKKQWLILYSKLLHKMGHFFLDTQFLLNPVNYKTALHLYCIFDLELDTPQTRRTFVWRWKKNSQTEFESESEWSIHNMKILLVNTVFDVRILNANWPYQYNAATVMFTFRFCKEEREKGKIGWQSFIRPDCHWSYLNPNIIGFFLKS